MTLLLGLVQGVCQALDFMGDYVKSCLPRSARFYDALAPEARERICRRIGGMKWQKTEREYRDRLDFLLCECFVNFKKPCFDYYAGKGCKLNRMYHRFQLRLIDGRLRDLLILLEKPL